MSGKRLVKIAVYVNFKINCDDKTTKSVVPVAETASESKSSSLFYQLHYSNQRLGHDCRSIITPTCGWAERPQVPAPPRSCINLQHGTFVRFTCV